LSLSKHVGRGEERTPNDHGARATPKNVSRVRHDRFPHPDPLSEGEGDVERATRYFHGNVYDPAVVLNFDYTALIPRKH
jgi:hypothetical protein